MYTTQTTVQKMLRTSKVAEILDVHVNEVLRLYRDGHLQGAYLPGSRSKGLRRRLRIYTWSVVRFQESMPLDNPAPADAARPAALKRRRSVAAAAAVKAAAAMFPMVGGRGPGPRPRSRRRPSRNDPGSPLYWAEQIV